MVDNQRMKLMLPGPVDVEDDVLAALAQPTLPHYGRAWLEIYNEAIDGLRKLFGTCDDLFLMGGPGTAALDAALGSLMRTGDKVLVLSNGFFGRRLGIMAGHYGLDVRLVEAPQDQPVDPEVVRRRLLTERDVQALVMVHLETSTGILNPLQQIAALAREFDVPIVVDAVSSMGGVPLTVDEWGIDVCVSVINKCLACPPAVAAISVGQRAWDQMDRRGGRAHGWYLNLRVWKDYAVNWASWHPYPTTLPTNNIVALLVSLHKILQDGLEAHYARYDQAASTVRAGLKRLGFEQFASEAYSSPLITAVRGLPGMDIADYRRYLEDEWRIMISGGLDELSGQIFRVGHIGKATSRDYSEQLLSGTEAYLRLKGLPARTEPGSD